MATETSNETNKTDSMAAAVEGDAVIEKTQEKTNSDEEAGESTSSSKKPPQDDNNENQPPPPTSSSQTTSKPVEESKKRTAEQVEEGSSPLQPSSDKVVGDNTDASNHSETSNNNKPATLKTDKSTTDGSQQEQPSSSSSSSLPNKPPPPRPIKKARTAYFIFADEKRPELQAAHPGEGVAVVARQLGHAWGSLGDEERAKYQLLAAEERARVAKELEEYKALYGDIAIEDGPGSGKNDGLVMPVARIRKICKLDPQVRGISKEATLLVTKCTELCLEKLGKETVKVARLSNRRKLLPEDVAQVCSSREQYLFLREDLKDILQQQVLEAAQKKESQQKSAAAGALGSNSKPLTAYFGGPK